MTNQMTHGALAAAARGMALLLPLGSLAVEPFNFDKMRGRLPKNVVPVDYDIAVVPNIEAKTLAGTESISLSFREATDRIVFNTLNLTLRDMRVDGRRVKGVAT